MFGVLYPLGKEIDMDEAQMHQAMLERMQQCEEALGRAEKGQASEDDWKVIWFECGLKKESKNGINC